MQADKNTKRIKTEPGEMKKKTQRILTRNIRKENWTEEENAKDT